MSTIQSKPRPLQFHLDKSRAQLVTALRLVDEGPISDLEYWDDLARSLNEAFHQLTCAQDAATADEDGRFSVSSKKGHADA